MISNNIKKTLFFLFLNLKFNTMKEIMNEIQVKFYEELEKKNSWGKNEVQELYLKITNEVYLEKMALLMEKR